MKKIQYIMIRDGPKYSKLKKIPALTQTHEFFKLKTRLELESTHDKFLKIIVYSQIKLGLG